MCGWGRETRLLCFVYYKKWYAKGRLEAGEEGVGLAAAAAKLECREEGEREREEGQ